MSDIVPEIDKRRSYRALSDRQIPVQIIDRIIKAASWAPSCFNNQPWYFLAAYEEEALRKMRESLAGGNSWAQKAPVLIAAITRPDLDCRLSEGREYAFFGLGLAVENLLLQAVREGLYAHPMAGFKPKAIHEAFEIGREYTVLTLIAVGYPGELSDLSPELREAEGSARQRLPEEQVFFRNRWFGDRAKEREENG
ncbi:MAG: nitroreductase family protein [Spirochaetales bacterium]|nr:nitroreductase family protein [Spirochaetales bacterium]MCF7938119.1 nitroreductase family protein [Spirochaetales bacterium]